MPMDDDWVPSDEDVIVVDWIYCCVVLWFVGITVTIVDDYLLNRMVVVIAGDPVPLAIDV